MDEQKNLQVDLPVSDEVLRKQMRQNWKELKKWVIIGIVVTCLSLIFMTIGAVATVRHQFTPRYAPTVPQTSLFQQSPLFSQMVLPSQPPPPRKTGFNFILLGIVILVCGIYPLVKTMINHYKLMKGYWSHIGPKEGYTAGQMAGFQFIPLFNLYWQFVAIWELAKRLNDLGVKHVNPQLALAFCVVNCCIAVPFLRMYAQIASIVLFIILFEQFNKAFTGTDEVSQIEV